MGRTHSENPFLSLRTPRTGAAIAADLRMSTEEDQDVESLNTSVFTPITPGGVETPRTDIHVQDESGDKLHRTKSLDPDLLSFLLVMFDQIPQDEPHKHEIPMGLLHSGCTTWYAFLALETVLVCNISYRYRRVSYKLSLSAMNALIQELFQS